MINSPGQSEVLNTLWQTLYQRYQSNIQELSEENELSLESLRLCLCDLFLTLSNKKDGLLSRAKSEEERTVILQATRVAKYMYQAVYGMNFLELHQEFVAKNSDPSQYATKPKLQSAITSAGMQSIMADIKNIFDPTVSPSMLSALKLEEENIKGRIIAQLEEGPITRTETLKMLIFIKNIQREAIGRATYDCQVQNITQFPNALHSSITADKKRFQFMVHSGGHYTAVECAIKDGVKQAIVMDAAQDQRSEKICKILEKQGFQVTFCGNPNLTERVQYDSVNCSFFSYDHLVASSRIESFFERVNKAPHTIENGRKFVSWKEMPGAFIRNAQSISFLKTAIRDNPRLAGSTIVLDDTERSKPSRRVSVLHRYLDMNAIENEEGKRLQKGITKVRVRAKLKVESHLESLSDKDLLTLFHGTKEEYQQLLNGMKVIEVQFQQFLDVIDELSDRSSSSYSSDSDSYESDSSVASSSFESNSSSPSMSRSSSPNNEMLHAAASEGQEMAEQISRTITERAQEIGQQLSERLSAKPKMR